jgi:hypothetical protein
MGFFVRREKGSWFTLEEYRKITTSSTFMGSKVKNKRGK